MKRASTQPNNFRQTVEGISLRENGENCLRREPAATSEIVPKLDRTGSLKFKEWLTTDEAAEYLGLSVGALRNMTSNGHVPYHKLGRRNRYRLTELRDLLLSQKRGGSRGN